MIGQVIFTGKRNPLHVVTEWLGNTPKVAQQHYMMMTEDHFQRAVAGPSGAASGAQMVQKAVPQPAALDRNDSQETNKPLTESGVMRTDAICCGSMPATESSPGRARTYDLAVNPPVADSLYLFCEALAKQNQCDR